MAILGPSTDYTDRDFDSLRARCRNLIRSAFPAWTDEDTANFGNLLVELFCFCGDVLAKYQDNQAREAFWARATQRKNLLALAKLIGFQPRGQTASTVDLQLSVAAPVTGTLTVPAGDYAATDRVVDPVRFRLLADAVWNPTESGTRTVSAINSDLFTESSATAFGPNAEYVLAQTPYLEDSLAITAADGSYAEVDDFLSSMSTDRHFTVTVDQDDRATVRFGNGVSGAIPQGTVTFSYETGGGAAGSRVETGKVSRLERRYQDDLGNPVQVTVTNPEPSSVALERQGIEDIRAAGPRQLRVLERTVSREDFEINALRVAGVARALMLTSDQQAGIPENKGFLYVVPEGGGAPTQQMLDDVLEMVTVTYPCTLTFLPTVVAASYAVVNVEARVYLSATAASVRSSIVAALEALFAIRNADGTPNESINFGYYLSGDPAVLAWSDVFNAVRDAAGVKRVDANFGVLLNGYRADVELDAADFPVLGTVTLVNAATGVPF